jgi:hypothetical protein
MPFQVRESLTFERHSPNLYIEKSKYPTSFGWITGDSDIEELPFERLITTVIIDAKIAD